VRGGGVFHFFGLVEIFCGVGVTRVPVEASPLRCEAVECRPIVGRRCDDGVRHTDRRDLPDSDSESFYCVRMSEKRRSRFGPAPKAGGARKQRTVRIPEGLDELVAAEAAELGVPVGDAVVAVLARGLGVAEPDYIRRNREQERLQGKLLDV
jgi:hypothetical protein